MVQTSAPILREDFLQCKLLYDTFIGILFMWIFLLILGFIYASGQIKVEFWLPEDDLLKLSSKMDTFKAQSLFWIWMGKTSALKETDIAV